MRPCGSSQRLLPGEGHRPVLQMEDDRQEQKALYRNLSIAQEHQEEVRVVG